MAEASPVSIEADPSDEFAALPKLPLTPTSVEPVPLARWSTSASLYESLPVASLCPVEALASPRLMTSAA